MCAFPPPSPSHVPRTALASAPLRLWAPPPCAPCRAGHHNGKVVRWSLGPGRVALYEHHWLVGRGRGRGWWCIPRSRGVAGGLTCQKGRARAWENGRDSEEAREQAVVARCRPPPPSRPHPHSPRTARQRPNPSAVALTLTPHPPTPTAAPTPPPARARPTTWARWPASRRPCGASCGRRPHRAL